MAIGTTKHPACGSRVEIPAYSDMWMRGARFGTVERVIERKGDFVQAGDSRGATIFRVRLDHPQARGKLRGYVADDCHFVGGR